MLSVFPHELGEVARGLVVDGLTEIVIRLFRIPRIYGVEDITCEIRNIRLIHAPFSDTRVCFVVPDFAHILTYSFAYYCRVFIRRYGLGVLHCYCRQIPIETHRWDVVHTPIHIDPFQNSLIIHGGSTRCHR